MSSPSLTVIILTFNEEIHLERCIRNVQPVAERVIIVDSYSTDQTLEIAQRMGAEVFQNPFVHQAQQFQWALDNVPVTSDWVMKLDADEYLMPELTQELTRRLPHFQSKTTGLGIKRRVFFMDRWIKRGYYPMILLRIWRNGTAFVEQKWMDEHVCLKHGQIEILHHDMVDHNLNNLSWWTEKHNRYATREAVERLGLSTNPIDLEEKKVKWYKSAYMRFPLFLRPFLYFFYRYILRGGFWEGRPGLVWHILQGFWFQFLVDAKIFQIKHLAKKNNKSIREVLTDDFGVKL